MFFERLSKCPWEGNVNLCQVVDLQHVIVGVSSQHSSSLTGYIYIIIFYRLAADWHPPGHIHKWFLMFLLFHHLHTLIMNLPQTPWLDLVLGPIPQYHPPYIFPLGYIIESNLDFFVMQNAHPIMYLKSYETRGLTKLLSLQLEIVYLLMYFLTHSLSPSCLSTQLVESTGFHQVLRYTQRFLPF